MMTIIQRFATTSVVMFSALLLLSMVASPVAGFGVTTTTTTTASTRTLAVSSYSNNVKTCFFRQSMSTSSDDDNDDEIPTDSGDDTTEEESNNNDNNNDSDEPLAKAVVKMDDGGSDLTNRFKYKVNALMGKFDPPPGQDDDERQDGNILNAMLKFPVRYTFNVVGKAGDDNGDEYVEQVKQIILDTSGDENGLTCQITPRGKKFVKVQLEVEVQSATMINTIYDNVGELDGTVMKF